MRLGVALWCLSISVEDDIIFSFMSLSCSICLCNWPFMDTWCCLLCVVLPGRLCDGPSSPCRLQATSCWAPPATSSSCCRKRRARWRVWSCHKKARSGSCRACCSEKHASNDGLETGDVGEETHLLISGFSVQFVDFSDAVNLFCYTFFTHYAYKSRTYKQFTLLKALCSLLFLICINKTKIFFTYLFLRVL